MHYLIQQLPLANTDSNVIVIGVLLAGGLVALILAMVLLKFFATWFRARLANATVPWSSLIGMFFRKVPYSMITDSRITAVKAGLPFTSDQLEAHFLAGGDVTALVNACIAADKAGIDLTFDRACAIDLATKDTGKNVEQAVNRSINPMVIDCPNPSAGVTKISAVAKDGIGVNVRARVTVRTNLDRFVGGATEETIVARVGEGIVTSVGSAASYKAVLENPDNISKLVLEKGVDASTAFEILSIDIADVDVADNIGARLQAEQAEADKQVAQAKAEMRRAAAVASEQEMAARTQEMRANVVAAEAEVPLAISEAFRSGNLGIMDYVRYQNVEADTQMRESIADDGTSSSDGPAS
tara:strand:+ start:9532 stop:10596 length:1065 start_codon:yes stop_codon:yes gene_type:complete